MSTNPLMAAMDDESEESQGIPSAGQTYGVKVPKVPRRKKAEPEIIEVAPEGALVPIDRERGIYQLGDTVLSSVGVQFPDEMTVDEWGEIGLGLFALERRVALWIGDWLVAGEKRYGITYAQIAEQLNRQPQTLYNWHWVCSKVEFSLRKENLYFGHYNLVAGMDEQDQAHWLKTASYGDGEKAWTVKQLQEAIKPKADDGEAGSVIDRFVKLAAQNKQTYTRLQKQARKLSRAKRLQLAELIDDEINALHDLKRVIDE